ncbi:hypothetical protein ACF0H5_010583 [Mactra antiquata]
MFRALYDYKTELSGYLTFQVEDQFTVLDSTQKDWFLAQNGFGEIGYIPKNYVTKDQANEGEVLKSIDRAIEIIHFEASSKGGQYTHSQRENLQKLIEHRQNVYDSYRDTPTDCSDFVVVPREKPAKSTDNPTKRHSSRRIAPAPPVRTSAELTTCVKKKEVKSDNVQKINIQSNNEVLDVQNNAKTNTQPKKENNEPTKCNSIQIVAKVDCATSPLPSPTKTVKESNLFDCSTVNVPEDIGRDLVEEIRKNTELSYKKSCVALETVLGHIGMKIPDLSELMDRIHSTIQMTDTETVESSVSSDYERLCELFEELTECKDDSQQRGWHLHEDEDIISNNLQELLSILENAKQSVSRKALSRENYDCIYSLVQYYQMENRLNLRLLLLRVFGAMCSLDSVVITHLLFSVLTTELAHELEENIEDLQRSSYVSLLLCMLFCTGESVPANLHDHLNTDFLGFVFNSLENPCSEGHEEQLTDLLVNFVLAFNLHFDTLNENLVMKVIEEKKTVKVFTEKILLLFNRDEDPVVMFDHKPPVVNSIMKLLQDMYSSPSTARILYTNDERVLLDIILRHLIDLPPGDKDRSSHLKLMQLYLQHADYLEHKHRYAELKECLQRIQTEEENTGDDKDICSFIFTQLKIFNNE